MKYVVVDVCGLCDDEVDWVIDGCNLLMLVFLLDCFVCFYVLLVDGVDVVEVGGVVIDCVCVLVCIYCLMIVYLELVVGEGCYCMVLMNVFGG